MKKSIAIAVLLAVLSVCGLAQTTYRPPTVYAGSLLVVKWTAGTINNGGHLVTIAVNSGTGTSAAAAQTSCAAPTYTACNFVFANSSGTVAVTQTLGTATASGNVMLAYIETDGTKITRISYGWQNGATWTGGASTTGGASSVAAISCLVSATCAVPTNIATGLKIVIGTSGALNAATPSVATVSGISPAFSSNTSYKCTGTPNGNAASTAILESRPCPRGHQRRSASPRRGRPGVRPSV